MTLHESLLVDEYTKKDSVYRLAVHGDGTAGIYVGEDTEPISEIYVSGGELNVVVHTLTIAHAGREVQSITVDQHGWQQ